MVTDTGKTLHADTLKPVNLPEPIAVDEEASGQPRVVTLGRKLPVAVIDDIWRLDDEWWRARALSRMYYAVILVNGRRLTLFKDLVDGKWYHQSY
ncbi:hypothetical protein [Dehalogenimonas etheniformans]|uniref:Uncharacterized protein n=1 Tax=Dehalogenimonas etheniformans TaxID=1536648 RepID=A0A2P5P5R0_9CHLR|nr:hypothetical protein [Dehalogenimonas etheniformans]PPD57641.1 hypothetical protein JP09_007820 [Dehalogenimonas etheniformans]QNT75982.1 hypothetical protein HX448_04405 [Dehalogenimonas etheniformans]